MSFLYANEPEAAENKAVGYAYDRSWKGLSSFLLNRYNNSPTFLIDVAQSAAKFAKRMKIGNGRFRRVMDVIEYGTPAVVLTSNLFSKLREFHRITTEKPNVYTEKEIKIRRLLGFSDPERDDDRLFIATGFDVGKDVCVWVSERPKTQEFTIEGFYKQDLQSAQDLWDIEHGSVFILIDFEERKFVWELSYYKFEDKLSINSSTIYYVASEQENGREALDEADEPTVGMSAPTLVGETKSPIRERLKSAVFKDFLRHFDVSSNVIYISRGLRSRKRVKFGENVNQFDILSFGNEIRKVLKRGRKRGYAFVGVPGTGKSTIIRKLEGALRDYPMVYLTADNFNLPYEVKETFKTISYMQPCIVVLEDLDSYNFEEKNERLGVFLDCIDDVNRTLNAVFIATINDTKLVHYTLINRPGRLDQVILINPPQSAQEAYEVMQARFGKLTSGDPSICPEFPGLDSLDESIFDAVLGNSMTQADICELVEKAVLVEDAVTNGSLHISIESILMSKRAIQVCNFGGNNPYEASGAPVGDGSETPHIVELKEVNTAVGRGGRTEKWVYADSKRTYRADTTVDPKGDVRREYSSSNGNGKRKRSRRRFNKGRGRIREA